MQSRLIKLHLEIMMKCRKTFGSEVFNDRQGTVIHLLQYSGLLLKY